jgi:hypothetical protein
VSAADRGEARDLPGRVIESGEWWRPPGEMRVGLSFFSDGDCI